MEVQKLRKTAHNFIHLNYGDILGNSGCIFICDALLVKNQKYRQSFFKCGYCDKEFVTSPSRLKNNTTKSCGCLIKVNMLEAIVTHGKSKRHYIKSGVPSNEGATTKTQVIGTIMEDEVFVFVLSG